MHYHTRTGIFVNEKLSEKGCVKGMLQNNGNMFEF